MRQGIESALPENRHRQRAQCVQHWEEVRRHLTTALELCGKASEAHRAVPQAAEPAVRYLFTLLEMALRDERSHADQMLDAAVLVATKESR